MTDAEIRRQEAYADWRDVYEQETDHSRLSGGRAVKQSTPIPGAAPRGVTRQGT